MVFDNKPAARLASVALVALLVLVLVLVLVLAMVFPLNVVEIVGKASPNLGKSLGFKIRVYFVPLSLIKILTQF